VVAFGSSAKLVSLRCCFLCLLPAPLSILSAHHGIGWYTFAQGANVPDDGPAEVRVRFDAVRHKVVAWGADGPHVPCACSSCHSEQQQHLSSERRRLVCHGKLPNATPHAQSQGFHIARRAAAGCERSLCLTK
jgi:hypothetical protein